MPRLFIRFYCCPQTLMTSIPSNQPRPDFLLIGAQKAGTTSLFFDLRQQPGVFIPDEKELRVLLNENVEAIEKMYRGHFEAAEPDAIRGDCSTHYAKRTEHTGVAERARSVLGPDLKLIYMLREPVQRLLSHHHHQSNTHGHMPLDEALDAWPELLDNSRYAFQLEAWLEHYPISAIHIVFFEEFKKNRSEAVRGCCEFLGAGFDPAAVGDKVYNQSAGKPKADAKIQNVRHWWIYRRLIRSMIPLEARLWLVRAMSPKVASRSQSLPENCAERVAGVFASDHVRLRELTGRDVPW